jgi:trans-aconitate methyltransferase
MNQIVTKYQFPQNIYFHAVLKKIAKLVCKSQGKPLNVIDFGCGTGLLKYFIEQIDSKIKVASYDIDPALSDVDDPWGIPYDIWVFNHVLMYMNEVEISDLLCRIKLMNPHALIIIGAGRQNYLSKIGSILLNQNAHNATISSIDSQIDIIQKQLKIISKSSVYLMTEIMSCRFKH